MYIGVIAVGGHKLWGVVGGKRVAGLGGLGEWVSGGRLTAGGGEIAGRACPAPTGWWGICERYRLGNTYKALQYPYRFPLDVTCGMVYTIGIRTVLFYYILYQLISDSVT